MNKLLISIGTLCAVLWGFITGMTFGFPQQWCEVIDALTLHVMSREIFQMANGFYYDVSNNDMPTVIFLGLIAMIFALTFFCMIKITKGRSQKYALGIIVFFSVLFRLILLPGELIHENDIYRYIWDGKTTLQGVNPYKYAPEDVETENLDALRQLKEANPVFHERIGHAQVPTIYPPAMQGLFVLPVLVNGDSLLVMKAFFVLFDLGALFLIIALLKHFNRDPALSMIYGWSPLVLFSIANGGHYDSVPVFFTLLSLLLLFKGRHLGGSCVLALATLMKFFSGVLLPIVLRPFKLRYVIFFGVILLLFYVPFFLWDETGISGVFEGLRTYNAEWAYNASLFAVIYYLLDTISPRLTETLLLPKIVVGCLYLGVLAFLSVKRSKNDWDVLHKCFWAVALLFLMNPVGDPWYFCWVMPFLCFFPYRSWILLSGLLFLSYLNFHSDIGITDMRFLRIPLIGWLTYVPFGIYWAIESRRDRYRQ